MARYTYPGLILSMAGILLSGMMLIFFFFPETDFGMGDTIYAIINSCRIVNRTPHMSLSGYPVITILFLLYIVSVFSLLISDHAGGDYQIGSPALLLPLSVLMLLTSLLYVLIRMREAGYCTLDLILLIMNMSLVAVIFAWFRHTLKIHGLTYLLMVKKIITGGANSDRRAAYSSYLLLLFFITLSVISAVQILKLKSGMPVSGVPEITAYVNEFRDAKKENIEFPGGRLTVGATGPGLEIKIFTDFLCSACSRLYGIEKYLLDKFRDRIKITYYNFPLDKNCNAAAETVYRNSCIASLAMIAAAGMDLFPEAHDVHYEYYHEYKNGYTLDRAVETLNKARAIKKMRLMGKAELAGYINSQQSADVLKNDIRLSKTAGIEATPTIFISGKRVIGVPPREYLEAIIREELEKK